MKNTIPCIQHIPDEMLLCILTYLNVKDMFSVCRVNHHWHRLAQTRLRRLDFYKCRLLYKKHWGSIRQLLSSTTREMLVMCCGLPGSNSFMYRELWEDENNLTIPMLKDIREKATHIQKLTLRCMNFTTIKLEYLPATLKYLDLEYSFLPKDFFADTTHQQPLPNLKHLNISYSVIEKSSDKVIRQICTRWPELHSLSMQSFRAPGASLQIIAKKLLKLKYLVGNADRTDRVQLVCQNLKQLEVLQLFGNSRSNVDWNLVMDSLVKLSNLKKLGVLCNTMTQQSLMKLVALTKLEYLSIWRWKVDHHPLQAAHPNKNLIIVWYDQQAQAADMAKWDTAYEPWKN